MTVLVLAAEHDLSVDRVIGVLSERAVPVCRVDTAWFPEQVDVAAEMTGDRARWTGRLRTPAHTVDLHRVRAVWFRGPQAFRFPDQLTTAERHHANLEAKYGVGGVLASLPALWVNHPSRSAHAAYKPRQLAAACAVGLTVPDTLITNAPGAVTAFCAGGPTVTKLLGASTIYEENVRKIGYTRLVDTDDLADLRGIATTAHLFQRWVPKRHEARVIVIGQHLTAVTIRAAGEAAHIDWRTDYDALSYTVVEPPEPVILGVRALMTALDLPYGALDFVVSPDGTWTFLEINPGGQYGWLEAETGAPFTAQLADLLTRGHA